MAIHKEKIRHPFHCHQCGLLMMMVRLPDSSFRQTNNVASSTVGWHCPFCDDLNIPTPHSGMPFRGKKPWCSHTRQVAGANVFT